MVGTIGLCGSLSVPYLVTRIHRWGTFILAFVGWIVAMGLLAQPHAWALFTGLALQLVAGAAVTIRLNLYVLDNVSQARLTQFEAMRMFLAGISWTPVPWRVPIFQRAWRLRHRSC